MASIDITEVSKIYDKGGAKAVDTVDIQIEDGEFIVLVGPSGCGKSTLLRMVAGLEDISQGTISIGDRVVNEVEPADRDIAMVFQNYALYPHMTVYDNHGLRPEEPRHAEDGNRSPRRGSRQDAGDREISRPQAARAFRRPAPARRHGPRDRAQARTSSSSTSRCRTSMPSCASPCAAKSASCRSG